MTAHSRFAPHPRSDCREPFNESVPSGFVAASDGRAFAISSARTSETPIRCHLMNVSGLTITRALRQLKKRASAIITSRAMAVIRRGLTLRSVKNPSCLRRKRFSAINAARERTSSLSKSEQLEFYDVPGLIFGVDISVHNAWRGS